MRSLKTGLLSVTAAAVASALVGCASVPYRDEVVVYVPVPVPVPVPCPRPQPHPLPPPIIVDAPSEQRPAPIDRNQDTAASLTKTREIRPTTLPVRPRGDSTR